MGVVLPSELAWVLGLIGIQWPNIDEDELKAAAEELRVLSRELTGHAGDAKADIEAMLGVNWAESLQLFEALWTKLSDGHLRQLGQGLELLGTGLDVAALVVEGRKLAAIVQLAVLAADVIADRLATVETLGASEALAAAQTAITRTIVKQLLDQAIQAVEQDGLRSIRFGPHEMNSAPTKFHYHQETWSYDKNGQWYVQNVQVRTPLPKSPKTPPGKK